ncbi:hypothetical protein NDU88_010301 [Pleurodeles waltl]|uniref:Secreted protein n=1 Tax=Pleurodeles waltl TaxID=8319 RepID=A0AAV7QU07_PLEWA|nr:hypothetical protein NDU88_010301 [Pleurodeles waltl]
MKTCRGLIHCRRTIIPSLVMSLTLISDAALRESTMVINEVKYRRRVKPGCCIKHQRASLDSQMYAARVTSLPLGRCACRLDRWTASSFVARVAHFNGCLSDFISNAIELSGAGASGRLGSLPATSTEEPTPVPRRGMDCMKSSLILLAGSIHI